MVPCLDKRCGRFALRFPTDVPNAFRNAWVVDDPASALLALSLPDSWGMGLGGGSDANKSGRLFFSSGIGLLFFQVQDVTELGW
eukprot:CAMPEP_0172320918 /NCGR_PEP_ID=MMETSP1058-20130122/41771_1 /TAXON_ID=83371 /ORGANISM="Detonula confervacea, Strain CCMP 353" /LENGTH=83 /DNA_ID=CAMNT_0013036279 /DNA_START=311 /DNA_END=559 /DNA_ORIENTATION=+